MTGLATGVIGTCGERNRVSLCILPSRLVRLARLKTVGIQRLYRAFANRMEEGERAPRVATPGLAEGDFDYRSKDPILAPDMTPYRSEVYHSIPERPQRPWLLVHLIHARVRRRPTGRGMPGIIPRVHDELMNSDPHKEARSEGIKAYKSISKRGLWVDTKRLTQVLSSSCFFGFWVRYSRSLGRYHSERAGVTAWPAPSDDIEEVYSRHSL